MDLFEVGEIVKTRGLRGCLKVLSYLESQNNLSSPAVIYIEIIPGQKKCFDLKKFETTGKFLFIELETVHDIESAKNFIGRKVFLPKGILKKLPAGEYYVQDIIGLDVFSEEGHYLGKIESVFPTGSNDVYVCKNKNKEILLPAIPLVVKQIDIHQRIMRVTIPDGLQP